MDPVLPSQSSAAGLLEPDSEELQLRVDSFRKLGYSSEEVRSALRKLGLGTDTNSVLGELVRIRTSTAPCGSDADERRTGLKDALLPPSWVLGHRLTTQPGQQKNTETELRPIVIDGSNVAMSHGNKEVFSCRGIQLTVNFFLDRGHSTVTVFVPTWRREQPRPDAPITDIITPSILRHLQNHPATGVSSSHAGVAVQAGQSAPSFSLCVTMASTTPLKDTGFTGALCLLLVALLLPAVVVSGQNNTTTNTTSQPANMTSGVNNGTTQAPTSNSNVSTVNAVTQSQTVTTGASTSSGATVMTTQFATTNINSTIQSAISTILGVSSKPMTQSNTATMASGGMTSTNGTSAPTQFSCPSFSCNKSECYSMYNSQNVTWCPADCFCQLMRQMDMCYTVSCNASCAEICVNTSQINCIEKCCNSTGCLESSFASMMMNTTTNTTAANGTQTTAMMSTPVTTTTATSPVNNGNKCHRGVCTGASCYTVFKSAELQTCSSSQPHCQLKKETVDSALQWTAGCFTNCSDKTTCEASTAPPCHLECCNATSTSCLWLNGTLNVPSFATRGPSLHVELVACLLCLLAVTLML